VVKFAKNSDHGKRNRLSWVFVTLWCKVLK
jgi:hypothetical protein